MVRKNAVTRVHGSYYSGLWDPAYIFFFSGGLEYNTPLFLIKKNIWGGEGGEGRYLACRGHVTQPRIDLFRLVSSFRKRRPPFCSALSSICHFNKFQGGASSSFLR